MLADKRGSLSRLFFLGVRSLFLSNGPGDPTMCKETIAQLTKIVNDPNYKKPIFGICLGNQLLGLAAGTSHHHTQNCFDCRRT